MSQIAKLMDCSKKIFQRFFMQVKSETSVRKRETTTRFDQRLIRKSQCYPFRSSEELKNDLCAPVTSRTIRNRLQEAGLKARNPRKVPLLSKQKIYKMFFF